MDIWCSMGGTVRVRLTGADTEGTLHTCNTSGIEVYDLNIGSDDLTVCFDIRRQDLTKLRTITQKRGDILTVIRRRGIYWKCKGLLRRPVLLIGAMLLIFLVSYLPSRIFFLRVEGNETVPTRLILEKCEEAGLSFGTSRVNLRSEKIKNALLESIPQLQWAGVNTAGCVATVSVRERSEPNAIQQTSGVSSIVATKDGIVTQCTVTRGSAVCRPGQAVRAGEVLISGYTDCGISIRAEQAQGEIYAQTDWVLSVKLPSSYIQRTTQTRQIKKYSLIIGKKRINLYKDSGISDSSCVKMYSENYMTLPGGFRLPFAIATEVWTYCDSQSVELDESTGDFILKDFSSDYLSGQMVAGTVTAAVENVTSEDGCFQLEGVYACHEMIGITRNEEIIKPYGKHD